MQIHVTDEAVMITELTDEDRQHLEGLLRGAAGRSQRRPSGPASAAPWWGRWQPKPCWDARTTSARLSWPCS